MCCTALLCYCTTVKSQSLPCGTALLYVLSAAVAMLLALLLLPQRSCAPERAGGCPTHPPTHPAIHPTPTTIHPFTESRKVYWGGGSVFLATATLDWKQLRPCGPERFEDGTLPFLNILGLQQG